MLLLLLISCLPSVISIQCVQCDSFSEYCQLDVSSCVGAKCATRTAILPQGFTRLQKLCISSDAPLGCRDTPLWEGRMGEECICEEDMCNSSMYRQSLLFTTLLFVLGLM
ncbi:hypothetical protein PRIPAC_85155 [Pristionchus pacificus]|uniref:Uncharacterized protein n=1 Tax=Pristionchus pacificus TaxID=54126 RepID=A0A2A6BLC7_PRIPA|nr:hypothetical protein PRIPAC_85155 [Pristionchus pacificus]|eukprot:PDM66697.1 hypothetical protein PRIPAC_48114 [Pristionchus pacificus]